MPRRRPIRRRVVNPVGGLAMLRITSRISLDEDELEIRFVRASGPGGQNVNKVASAVQLRFDVARSSSLPEEVRQRLLTLSGSRLTTDGVLVIQARRHRTQEQNRRDAIARLVELVRRAAVPPTPRHKTRPTRASRRRRLESKRHRSRIKRFRQRPASE